MGARLIMGSFGGAVARAKISRLRKSTWTETETLKILKQKGKKSAKKFLFLCTSFLAMF